MDKDILGTAISSAIDTATAGMETTDPNYKSAVWKAVAEQVINHLKNFMEITVEVPSTNNIGIIVSGTATVTSQGTNEPVDINVTGPTKIK